MKSKPILPAALALGLFALAFAPAARAVEFRLIGWESADTHLELAAGEKPVPLRVSTAELSPTYSHKEDGPITLYKRVRLEDKTINQTACTVIVPPGLTKGLLLLIPGDQSKAVSRQVLPSKFGFNTPNAPLIYDYVWLDDSLEKNPPGTIVFHNFSRLPITLRIAQRQLTLAPRDTTQIPLDKGAPRMAFQAAAQINGRWKMFSSNPLATDGPQRLLVILRDGPEIMNAHLGPDTPNISIISLFDWEKPAPAAPAAPAATDAKSGNSVKTPRPPSLATNS